ncbi:MAG: UDP-N-acetylmuramoyl-L-alanyl-D-glutamate--2,6-diaminopimelate ligase [Gemmatimonadaceae bacterium]
MKRVPLSDIREALAREGLLAEVRGDLPDVATQITDDSRAVQGGSLFVAVRGSTRDGHDYVAAAERSGSVAAVVEDPARTALPALVVTDGRRAAGVAAAAFYGHPAASLSLIGVTGTNGKSTTVSMLRHLLDDPISRSASIGTLGVLRGSEGEELPGGAGLTTPGPIELQHVLRRLVDAGVRTVALEVSSHSLDQRRVEGLRFGAAIFTNLTRDHLDYHGTMEAYFAAKARLVEQLAPDGTAVVNVDDLAWRALPPAPARITVSTGSADADIAARAIRCTPRGSEWTLTMRRSVGGRPASALPVHLPLIGDFNVANAVAAAAGAVALGAEPDVVAARLSSLPQVPGRLEILNTHPTVLRDYAHTPDALQRALGAVRPFATGRVIVVFGCGGDRDKGKRPEMGAIAERAADFVILTSDNPRTENPEAILDQIEQGMTGTNHERIEDRRRAIARALMLAHPDDVVLLAGKGHETYQVKGTTKHPFDEKRIVSELLLDQGR